VRKLALLAAVLSFSGSAFAADMAVKSPAPPVAAPSDPWTGFYTGGSIGARWSDVKWDSINFGAANPAVASGNPASLDSTSVRLGGYAGYNLRIAPAFLIGIEGDIAWADNKKSSTGFPGEPFGAGTSGVGNDFVNAKLGWDASLRGRVGILLNPNWLVYGTGGAAWQQLTTSASCTAIGNSFCGIPAGESLSTTKSGWTVGAGVETSLGNHWFGRIEYRYADFGNITNVLPPAAFVGFLANVNVKTNTATAGLAYKW
jgi:outer membrane immunogenic protein